MDHLDPPPFATVPLPPGMGDPDVTARWAAHVAAGRIGAPAAAPAAGADHRLGGLAAALGIVRVGEGA